MCSCVDKIFYFADTINLSITSFGWKYLNIFVFAV